MMPQRDLVVTSNPILRQVMPSVEWNDHNTPRIIRDLWDTMFAINAAGLAANQIGEKSSICVIKIKSLNLINPLIVYRQGTYLSVEGCFSIPGYKAIIPRSRVIRVLARRPLEKNNKLFTIDNPLQAAIIQHEIDHLNGILISDYVEEFNNKQGGILITKYEADYVTATTHNKQMIKANTK